VDAVLVFAAATVLLLLRQIAPTNPAKPAPINAMELGSGTEIGCGPEAEELRREKLCSLPYSL
jgi:hypothetical protein